MIRHIDLSSVLRRSVCDLYSNLVTRPTGAAVRTEIEHLVEATPERTLTVIDFSHVGLLDYSCADEVVAKLLLRFATGTPASDAYFVFRGMEEWHLDAIEAALVRYALALVSERHDGHSELVGTIPDDEQRAWEAVYRLGSADAATVAASMGADATAAERLLNGLSDRRLLMRFDQLYLALGYGT
jgi:hypothetical protein